MEDICYTTEVGDKLTYMYIYIYYTTEAGDKLRRSSGAELAHQRDLVGVGVRNLDTGEVLPIDAVFGQVTHGHEEVRVREQPSGKRRQDPAALDMD